MTLEERVADALYEAFGGDIDRVNMSHAARAITPLVLEEAARVAEATQFGGFSPEYNAACRDIADAIRALRDPICRHGDPRCEDDPCPRGVYEAQCKP